MNKVVRMPGPKTSAYSFVFRTLLCGGLSFFQIMAYSAEPVSLDATEVTNDSTTNKWDCTGSAIHGLREGLWTCYYVNAGLRIEMSYKKCTKNGAIQAWMDYGSRDLSRH